ncbi:MAG: autoinducer synthetase family protein [Myxococcaceae bacterium]|nr:autoinducer synthetase family protein [Myxococcaceae bacterium]
MFIETSTASLLRPATRHALLRYRYRVFVHELGWNVPAAASAHEQETDQFDTDATVHVIAHLADGSIGGYARLLPTWRPYLLSEVFPTLFASGSSPRSQHVWELSRFSARGGHGTLRENFDAARSVFAHALLAASERGASEVIGVLTPAVERVCRLIGARIKRLADPQLISGERVLACVVELAREGALLDLARAERAKARPAPTSSAMGARLSGAPNAVVAAPQLGDAM